MIYLLRFAADRIAKINTFSKALYFKIFISIYFAAYCCRLSNILFLIIQILFIQMQNKNQGNLYKFLQLAVAAKIFCSYRFVMIEAL